jgi:hypothetical protein
MKKIMIPVLVAVAVLVLSGCSFFGSKVPQSFINKHNEAAELEKEAVRLSDVESIPEWNTLEQQLNDGNYAKASQLIDSALNNKKETAVKLDSIDKKLAELKSIISEIKDSEVKAGAEKFVEISNKENSAKVAYNNLQLQMIEKSKTVIGILLKNPKSISTADSKVVSDLSKQIDDLKVKITAAEKEMTDVQSQYKTEEEVFFKLAGMEKTKQ